MAFIPVRLTTPDWVFDYTIKGPLGTVHDVACLELQNALTEMNAVVTISGASFLRGQGNVRDLLVTAQDGRIWAGQAKRTGTDKHTKFSGRDFWTPTEFKGINLFQESVLRNFDAGLIDEFTFTKL